MTQDGDWRGGGEEERGVGLKMTSLFYMIAGEHFKQFNIIKLVGLIVNKLSRTSN